MRSSFHQQLANSWHKSKSLLCVGLDPHPDLLGRFVNADDKNEVLEFCMSVVDATHDLVCAFKPQIAHFAALGSEDELQQLITYIHEQYPEIPVILDAKRGDIGSTAERYAIEVFERYQADAVTVNPFLGWDTVETFLLHQEKGVIILCRTSNDGSPWLQDYPPTDPMYLRIARKASEVRNPNILLVIGATYTENLREVRGVARETTFLVPGVGSQGGNVREMLAYGRREDGLGLVVNVSRSIMYAGEGADYLKDVRREAEAFRQILSIES